MDHYSNIRGGDLFLAVGQNQTHFRFHSHFLTRESEWWRDQLLGPGHSEDTPLRKGNSLANAYFLRDESPEDFRHLLTVFYNKSYGDYSGVTNMQWMPILRYAHKWGFKEVEALALRYLDNRDMDIADRIVFYQRNKIPKKYILPYYVKLASRSESLDQEECRHLGYMNYWFLTNARDALYAKLLSSNTAGSFDDLDKGEVTSIVIGAYGRTINNMDPTPVTKDPSERPQEDVGATVEEESLNPEVGKMRMRMRMRSGKTY